MYRRDLDSYRHRNVADSGVKTEYWVIIGMGMQKGSRKLLTYYRPPNEMQAYGFDFESKVCWENWLSC